MTVAELFARYAYPPNELGYCGPTDAGEVLRCTPNTLEATARCFEGTWPYFEFIAQKHGLDPLDKRVIESYWLGGELTEAIDVKREGNELLDTLARAGGTWAHSPDDLLPGMTPDHNFHVFAVYPWLGLLTRNISDQPRLVLDRCRIRWGTVVAVESDEATVLSQALAWNGSQLSLPSPTEEQVIVSRDGVRLSGNIAANDVVALHWDWVCGVLSEPRLLPLRESTRNHIAVANQRIELGQAR